jgi:hypothetical protein
MFKSKIVQIQKCLNLNLFNFKIVQILKNSKMKTVQFFKKSSILKKSVQIRKMKTKTETKKEKLRKTSPKIKKNRLEQVKTGSEYSRKFLKPEKNLKHATLIGPAH